jgi:hypothetical protein
MNADITFIALTIVDTIGMIIIFCGLCSERLRTFPMWHKVGMILIIVGMLDQICRNVSFFMTGISPSDAALPIWAFKDIGVDLIAMTYAVIALERFIDSNKTPPPPPKAVRKPNETSTNKTTTSVRQRKPRNSNPAVSSKRSG